MSRLSVHRLRPPPGARAGEYDVDAVVVEYRPGEGISDFRLELGLGYVIYWAVPAGPGERLRLALVDSAVFHVEEAVLEADPFLADLTLEWTGLTLPLGEGRWLAGLRLTLHSQPASYRCEVVERTADGSERRVVFAWTDGTGA